MGLYESLTGDVGERAQSPDPTVTFRAGAASTAPSTGSEHRLGPPRRRQKRQLPKVVAVWLRACSQGPPSMCQGQGKADAIPGASCVTPHLAHPGTFPPVLGVIPALGRQVGRWLGHSTLWSPWSPGANTGTHYWPE